MAHANPRIWEVKERGSGLQGYPWLHPEFEDSLGYETMFQKQSPKSKPKEETKGCLLKLYKIVKQ